MKQDINKKTAFVAGSSDGIGRAVAEGLAAEGCGIVLCARRVEALRELGGRLETEHGIRTACVAADLNRPEEIDRAVNTTLEMFGAADVLVTNNGGPPAGAFEEIDESAWSEGWHRTLMSAVRLIRGFLPGMRSRKWGRIINITSISVRQPIPRLLLSNSYRAAVTALAKTLSDETAADGITVNCIAPGYIKTSRLARLFEDRSRNSGRTVEEELESVVAGIPARRLGMPDEIAHLACFLASERASYITGSTILVDGGLHRGLA